MIALLSFLQILRDLFLRFLPFSIHRDYRFAFLVHSRDVTDIYRKFPFAKKIPQNMVEWWCKHSWPIVVSKVIGLKSLKDGKEVPGYIIGVPMTAHQMLENRKLAVQRIIQACKLAEKLGVRIIGLGALTSSITKGGLSLLDKVKSKVTTGNALTVVVTFKHVQKMLKKNTSIQKIAIVGGTGSIGRVISELLIKKFPEKEYLIFARTKEHLDDLLQRLRRILKENRLKGYLNNIENLNEAELVIVTTTAAGAFIKPEHLKANAIIYDITQPQNVSPEIQKKRKDVLILEGGLMKGSLDINFDFGLPAGTIFSCLAETIILALEKRKDNFSIGNVGLDKVLEIRELAKQYGLKPAFLERIGKS